MSKVPAVQLQAMFDKALDLHRRGDLAAARAIYTEVLRLDPRHFDSLHLLGVIAYQNADYRLAVDLIGKAIRLYPNNAAFYNNRGNAFLALERGTDALASLDKAVRLEPNYAEAHYNRGRALQVIERLEDAVASYARAICLKPDYAEAFHNRGIALRDLRQIDAALASFDRAISIRPNYAEACFSKSAALLLRGEFRDAWDLYEWRWDRAESRPYRRHFTQPQWSGGESLDGKTVLLHCEQGLGDTLQFCRYVKMVAALGARVLFEIPPALAGLLKGLDGVADWIVRGADLPPFDLHCPLLSLPKAFGTDLSGIPAGEPYLRSDPGKVAEWNRRLGPKSRPRVGLVWSGNASFKNDHNRSVALSALLPYLPPDLDYVSLQKDLRDADRPTLEKKSGIRHFGDEIEDFTDTAALTELMDVVVSTDTSVPHLTAGMGKATWLMLGYVPDWRWLLDRDDCPWYPSARLFRQPARGDWRSVFERIRAELMGLG